MELASPIWSFTASRFGDRLIKSILDAPTLVGLLFVIAASASAATVNSAVSCGGPNGQGEPPSTTGNNGLYSAHCESSWYDSQFGELYESERASINPGVSVQTSSSGNDYPRVGILGGATATFSALYSLTITGGDLPVVDGLGQAAFVLPCFVVTGAGTAFGLGETIGSGSTCATPVPSA